ncbi:multiple sugar transport system ATP-binding protein [Candidatus Termititenax persephonae]|uniref:Multiple sugar transport system ATP-binding protein n=1 Tax=Candidatus Termititenax persephonae TaxID=2218525 RepID=A0A388TJJ1_9BACT|nr:multiple sugar transport system ATP-binding protein [Candidatus Termititenax persephonae]
MASVQLKDLVKSYDGTKLIVKNINLTIKDGEFLVLVGPSGCGKTTTLRMIAGLEEITGGEVLIGGKVVNDVHPKDRDIAMVFQNYALYPHMSVRENMSFGLKLRRTPPQIIKERVDEASEILGLAEYLDRKPKQLSGGQRQRVALGRAIVRHPKVFLMDEPLSNLDAKLRVQTRGEIKKLHNRLHATIVYVTHDQVEAMTLGDRIAVMDSGIIQQCAPAITVYDQPANIFVGGFIGSPAMNFIKGCIAKTGRIYEFATENFKLQLPKGLSAEYDKILGKDLVLGIRPTDIYDKTALPWLHLEQEQPITVKVDFSEKLGMENYVYVHIGSQQVTARVDSHIECKENQDLNLYLNLKKMHVFDAATQRVLI